MWFPAALALGGVLGNLLDRLYHGYVTDFIYIGSLEASANVADFAIFLGLALFFLFDLGALVFALGKRYRNAVAGSA
jgi:signal peptidase II